MEDLYVAVGPVFPEMDREAGMHMNIKQTSFAVGLVIVRVEVRMLTDFAEALPQHFLLAPVERCGEVEHLHRN